MHTHIGNLLIIIFPLISHQDLLWEYNSISSVCKNKYQYDSDLDFYQQTFVVLSGKRISHFATLRILRNVINVVWKWEIMSWFTKLSFIYDKEKINWSIERIESNK
jgi:hypothetical protein